MRKSYTTKTAISFFSLSTGSIQILPRVHGKNRVSGRPHQKTDRENKNTTKVQDLEEGRKIHGR